MLAVAMGSKPLPTENAFLVQLAEGVEPALGEFAGRVEHLASGRRARFGSREELFAQFERMLAQRRDATGSKPKMKDL